MTSDDMQYLGTQLALFEGGYRHVMVEFTAHLTGSGATIPVGVMIQDHATGELIAYQVPIFVADATDPMALGDHIGQVLAFVRTQLSPF